FMCYLYNISGMEKEARELLKKWAAFSAAENPLWKSLVNKNKYINKYADRTKYYYEKAWVELLYGIGRYALRYFGRLISYDCLKEEYQCDAVFASILYGDVRRGRRYAQMLKEFLKREKLKRGNIYYNYCRKHVRIEILSIWYDDNDGEIERLLRESHSMEICHDCTSCLCKGLECLEVLFLLKKGKTDEAAEKLERSLRLFPFDEYMNALKHSGAAYLK
ncbi:MAG: hypothetical protein LUG83_02570, partial [Lachnospiraceae bacterium]|nr:hypothetical protein [Lachnospiraceae bacterium]